MSSSQGALRCGKSEGSNRIRIILRFPALNDDKPHQSLGKSSENENVKLDQDAFNKCNWKSDHELSSVSSSHQANKFQKMPVDENNDIVCDKKKIKSSKPKLETSEGVQNPLNESIKRRKNSQKCIPYATWEQKELKKLEKLHVTKLEKINSRLEKLCDKTRILIEEKRNFQSGSAKRKSSNGSVKLSAALSSRDRKMEVEPGGKLSTSPVVNNVGTRPWKCGKLVCSAMEGIALDSAYFEISPVEPGDGRTIDLTGRASHQSGVYPLTCRVCGRSKELCDPIDTTKMVEAIELNSIRPVEIIVSSQKKIEENISEIEETLRRIHFLSPFSVSSCSCYDSSSFEKNSESSGKVGGDSMEKGGKERGEEGEKMIRNSLETEDISDEFENIQANSFDIGKESENSDSESSFSYFSGEEHNFVGTTESERPNPDDYDDYDDDERSDFFMRLRRVQESEETREAVKGKESTITSPSIIMRSTREEGNDFVGMEKTGQRRNTSSESVEKYPEGNREEKVSGISREEIKEVESERSGNEKSNRSDSASSNSEVPRAPPEEFSRAKENWNEEKDGIGRRTYKSEKTTDQTRFEGVNENCGGTSVNNFSIGVANGISNVAFTAVRTAKFLINGLQFVLGKGEEANEEPSIKASMLRLFEMGFRNFKKNKTLLLIHNNDLTRVVEELIDPESENFTIDGHQ